MDEQILAMNEQLLLNAVRQHELVETVERLNAQLEREIAERKQLEHTLVTNEKLAATARLAAVMSHEINNPLAAITNLVYLLTPLQTSPEAKAYIAALDDQVNGLTRIATQMLKFHRDHNQPSNFKLQELLHTVFEFFRPRAERHKICVTHCIETEGMVLGYRGEIIQVMTNLLLNALDATPSDGKISVHLYAAPSWLREARGQPGYCISIADSGSGIDQQDYSKIFEPFFTTRGDKGSGLGLWLCMGIVNRAGGSIRIRSSRIPNRTGTCFSVFLPAQEASLMAHSHP